jgi:competence protein ComEC
LLIDPNEIYNPGFQLSFAAVLSIATIYPLIEKRINALHIRRKFLKYVIMFVGVSISAQIGTMPLTLIYFSKISLIALLTNLVVIPAIGVIIGVAIFTFLISTLLPLLAVFYASANDLISFVILNLVSFSGSLNFSHIVINQYSVIDAIIFFTLLIILIYFIQLFRSRAAKIILVLLTVLNIFLLSSIDDVELLPENYLSVMMIDIGQGDSFLIKFPNGKSALVDAGNATIKFDNGERVVKPLLSYLGVEQIDYAFISHIDSDHYAGFISLIQSGIIKSIYKPKLDSSLSKDVKFENFVYLNKISVNYYDTESIRIGNCQLYILNDQSMSEQNKYTSNNKSGVFKIVFGNTSFLFTGDIEKRVEKTYISLFGNFLNSDVLKLAHHGSKTSSSEGFLNFVDPEISLISAGVNNQFSHPSDIVINRLNEFGTKILRTDKEGAVLLRSDGTTISYINWKDI